jgi:hypothetical protein
MRREMQRDIGTGLKKSDLVPGGLYIVGENHEESNARREEEKKFALARTGSSNYWTEDSFPGIAQGMADKMEVRALYSAALLAVHFQIMADGASRVVESWGPAAAGWSAQTSTLPATTLGATAQKGLGQDQEAMKQIRDTLKKATGQASQIDDAQAAFTQFLNVNLSKVIQDLKYLERTWKLDSSAKEYFPVRAVFDHVDTVFKQYLLSLYGAVAALADSRAALLKVIPQLMAAADRPDLDSRDLGTLENYLRVERSRLMGEAAGASNAVGVWKVGDEHISDILRGALGVGAPQLNIVSRDQFNTQFRAWKREQSPPQVTAPRILERSGDPSAEVSGGQPGPEPVIRAKLVRSKLREASSEPPSNPVIPRVKGLPAKKELLEDKKKELPEDKSS